MNEKSYVSGKEVTAQQIIEWFMINHAHGHLEEVRTALDAT